MAIFFTLVKIACEVFTFAIVVRAILSWFSVAPHNTAIGILNQITEPILAPIRRFVPRVGMVDFSPLIAVVVLQLIYYVVP